MDKPPSATNRLLGYPADARLLLVNADDFGMCHSVNAAIMGALAAGIVRSTTLMVPCPWALHATHFLAAHPEIPFGVHLTVIADWFDYRWGPLTSPEKVPTLVNGDGHFYNFDQMPQLFAQLNLDELTMEFRAQIEWVLAAGLKPTHLDWHCLRLSGKDDIFDVMLGLAREYGLALRIFERAWSEKALNQGLPAIDQGFLDSYHVDPATKAAHYTELLRRLPAGLSEWAVHPALDSAELLAIDPETNHIRQSDYDFLVSPQAQAVIRQEGIILLDYRALQAVWRDR